MKRYEIREKFDLGGSGSGNRGHTGGAGGPGNPSGSTSSKRTALFPNTAYAGFVYDLPVPKSNADKKGFKLKDKVRFSYASPTQRFQGAGVVVGFAGPNDVVIEDKVNQYFVDAKNVFRQKSKRN